MELVSQDFVIKPSVACQKTLAAYGLLMKTNEQGKAQILIEQSGLSSDTLSITHPINNPIKLTFWLTLQNPYFPNITRLARTEINEPADSTPIPAGTKTIYYFSNLDPQNKAILGLNTGQAFLSKWNMVRTYDQLALLTPTFSSTAESFKLLKRQANSPSLQQVYEVKKKPEQNLIFVDLRGLEPGWYIVQSMMNGATIESINYLNPELFTESVFGVIDIYLDKNLNFKETIKYALQFERRQSKWRYVIIDRNDLFNSSLSSPIEYNHTVGSPFPLTISFSKKTPNEIGISEKEQLSYYPADIYVLETDQELPSLEQTQAKLTLQLKSDKSRILPLLAKQSIEPKIFIHL